MSRALYIRARGRTCVSFKEGCRCGALRPVSAAPKQGAIVAVHPEDLAALTGVVVRKAPEAVDC
jgi:hypothetical protein